MRWREEVAVKDGEYEHDPPLSVCLFVITEQKQDSLSKKSYGNNFIFSPSPKPLRLSVYS